MRPMTARSVLSTMIALTTLFAAACERKTAVQESQVRHESSSTCIAAGGSWRPVCMSQTLACVTTYRDAGKKCSDSAGCLGLCLVDEIDDCPTPDSCVIRPTPEPGSLVEGKCQIDDDPCGSFIEVRQGRALPTKNVD